MSNEMRYEAAKAAAVKTATAAEAAMDAAEAAAAAKAAGDVVRQARAKLLNEGNR